jgi:DNA polymerase III delta prime subunit
MFLIEKYFPKSLEDSFFHNDIIAFLKNISSDNEIPNMIFCGPPSSGKKTLVYFLLSMIYNNSIYKTHQVKYNVYGSSSKVTEEEVTQSDYHCEITPKGNNYDRYLIRDVVKEYAKKTPLQGFKSNKTFNVVVIHNFGKLSQCAQDSLRMTMEQYTHICRFILWCGSLSDVKTPLNSRCIIKVVPSPEDDELKKYLLMIVKNEGISITTKQINNIIEESHGNIKKALWYIDFIKHNIKLETNYDKSIATMCDLILEKDLKNVLLMRPIYFGLMITNYIGTNILRDLIKKLITSNKISNVEKLKIVENGCQFDYRLVQGRREILQIEAFFVSIINLLSS